MASDLRLAAQAVLQANCRPHREKAMRRLEAVLAGNQVAQEGLVRVLVQDLLRYVAQDVQGQGQLADPVALALLERAREVGLW